MDGWGMIIFAAGTVLWFVTRRKQAGWLFVAGLGAGLLVGAVWAAMIVNSVLR
jgi:hypothetical protein